MKQLHYAKALHLYASIEKDARKPSDLLFMAQCHAGLQQWDEAQKGFLQALNASPDALFSARVLLHLCRLYTQQGRLEKASQAYMRAERMTESSAQDGSHLDETKTETSVSSLHAFALLAHAWLAYEQGQIQLALDESRKVCDFPDRRKFDSARCEAWTLQADLLSVLHEDEQAIACYQKALSLCESTPANWRSLRKALIFSNLADVYEGEGDYLQALDVYREAFCEMDQIHDDEIVDLAGCCLEIILSCANCLLLWKEEQPDEESDSCGLTFEQCLDQAKKWKDRIHGPARLYWNSRICFLKGMEKFYLDQAMERAFPDLLRAYLLQNQFLQASPVSSHEYVGRIAYYGAYCLDHKYDQSQLGLSVPVTQEELYQKALYEFERCAFKDPRFFRFSIASIHNELGTIALHQNSPDEAARQYRLAVRDYRDYLEDYPDDLPARESLVAVYLNELSALRFDQTKSLKILDDLFDQLEVLNQDDSMQEAVQEACALLMDRTMAAGLMDDSLQKRYLHMVYGASSLKETDWKL